MANILRRVIMRKYKDLDLVAKKYYKDSNFCSVVAVATVCNMSFGKARIKMEKAGRPHRKGAYQWHYHEVIKRRGFKLEPVYGFEGHHAKTMGKKLSSGTYLVSVRGHVLAIVDGVINDWSASRSHRVREVYRVTKD